MKEIQLNAKYSEEIVVTDDKLANKVGSGLVAVYATPMMIAQMEHAAAACLAPFLDEGETSVGVMMNTTHDAATPCGMKVFVEAEIIAVDKKKVSFKVVAKDEKDVIGTATHDRFIVIKDKFESRAQSKLEK